MVLSSVAAIVSLAGPSRGAARTGVTAQADANAWQSRRGYTPRVELTGDDAQYRGFKGGPCGAEVSGLGFSLPTAG